VHTGRPAIADQARRDTPCWNFQGFATAAAINNTLCTLSTLTSAQKSTANMRHVERNAKAMTNEVKSCRRTSHPPGARMRRRDFSGGELQLRQNSGAQRPPFAAQFPRALEFPPLQAMTLQHAAIAGTRTCTCGNMACLSKLVVTCARACFPQLCLQSVPPSRPHSVLRSNRLLRPLRQLPPTRTISSPPSPAQS
jgi:hypothetical protein